MGVGDQTPPSPPPPPHTLFEKIKLSTVEPQYNKGPRDWQNMFVIARFVNLYWGSFSYCLIFYYYWSKKKKKQFVRPRTLFWRFQCNIHFHKNSIFVGIRIFQHLTLLLVRFEPISLSPTLLHFQTNKATNYSFLKQIISADDVVSDAFHWHTRQNEGITGTYKVISWSVNF